MVRRYSVVIRDENPNSAYVGMEESESGAFVKYSDYEALRLELDDENMRLRVELDFDEARYKALVDRVNMVKVELPIPPFSAMPVEAIPPVSLIKTPDLAEENANLRTRNLALALQLNEANRKLEQALSPDLRGNTPAT